jgi:hypothetical protein
MEKKISWTDFVRYEEVLLRVKEERNVLHAIKRMNNDWIGYILHRNCLLKQVIDGKIDRKIEVTGRRGRRHKQLLYSPNENRGYCKLKAEALNGTVRRTGFGRGNGPIVGLWNEGLATHCVPHLLYFSLRIFLVQSLFRS